MNAMRRIKSHAERETFAYWIVAIPILLIVTFLGIRQVNLYPPAPDEYYAMYNSGWIVNAPYTLLDVADSIQRHSPNQSLGYYFLLNLWGRLTTYDLALGRALGILCGLLSLSIVFRLGKDFVAPIAGLCGLIIVASNAFYNLYVPYVRMYSLLPAVSGIVLWLYLRIVSRPTTINNRDYIALCVSTYVMVNVHPYSIIFLASLGIYHLLFLKRDRRWWHVTASVCFALLLFSPYVLTWFNGGMDRSAGNIGETPLGDWNAYVALFIVLTNDQPLLATLSIVGVVLSVHRMGFASYRYLIPVVLFLIVVGVLAENTGFVTNIMRHHIAVWPLFMLLFSAGFFGLYRTRKWTIALVLLWVVAGISFNRTVDWIPTTGGHGDIFRLTPWQLISAQAANKNRAPFIAGYRVSTRKMDWPSYVNYSQMEHYFDSKGIEWKKIRDPHEFRIYMSHEALGLPEVWIVSQTSVASNEEIIELKSTMLSLEYELCDTVEIGVDTVIHKHVWNAFTCNGLAQQFYSRTELIDYRYYGAIVDRANSEIQFYDEWSGRVGREVETLLMSYQVISQDWENVAQMDLPLVHEGKPRRFSIDVAGVPAGSYRLMTILYDKSTGERVRWIDNDNAVPELLVLEEIIVPELD